MVINLAPHPQQKPYLLHHYIVLLASILNAYVSSLTPLCSILRNILPKAVQIVRLQDVWCIGWLVTSEHMTTTRCCMHKDWLRVSVCRCELYLISYLNTWMRRFGSMVSQ